MDIMAGETPIEMGTYDGDSVSQEETAGQNEAAEKTADEEVIRPVESVDGKYGGDIASPENATDK